jgi:2',3'-cyclic-nucleotide 2'-phosphodiesterase (5'-nucleotidase family)
VSANVLLCDKDLCVNLAKASVLVTAGKRKVAILGYLHPDALGFTPEERMADGKYKIQIKDPAPFIKGFVERYRKEADVLVVLSHAGVEEDRKVAQDIPGIDVIIGAHSQTMLVDPIREGMTVIGQAASDGQYVGKLVLKFNEDGKPGVESYELIPLTKNIADDPEVKAVIGIKTAAAN